jgi:sarcosine oxidase
VPGLAAVLAAAGVPHEVLAAAEAQARWPGMRFDGDVVFHPQAGTLDARAAVAALLEQATTGGARVHFDAPVREVVPGGGGVVLGDGTPVAARAVVVAAGGWVGPLLAGTVALPPLQVTRQSVFHFPRRDPAAPAWPTVIHENGRAVYHLPGGPDGGAGDDRKIGLHDGGPAAVAGRGAGTIDPVARELVTDYVRRWLPGLEPTPRAETTCLYTATPTEDFLLDRVDDLVVCSPCSGHGAKFAPLIGELVADLVTGAGSGAGADAADEPVPERFRLAAHRAGRLGSASL